jgi:hypothetical protein
MLLVIEKQNKSGVRDLLHSQGYLMVAEIPGLDAFYIHDAISASYLGKRLARSEQNSKGIFARFGKKFDFLLRNGLRASLRRI